MKDRQAELYSFEGKKVFVAGHKGMVGSALVRRLGNEKCAEILTASRTEIDLRLQRVTEEWMCQYRPHAVFLSAAKVGGILANNNYPVDFLYDNLMIAANVIHAAHVAGVEKLMFLGSSCIYPKFSKQPIDETELLSGPFEPTNEWYAIAKIAGIKLCQAYRRQHRADFISAIPASLYGPGDNFDIESCHVIPALMQKIHDAKATHATKITAWGTGTPRREFLHVDDCADALIFLMKFYSGDGPINIGCGLDISITELTQLIMNCVGFEGMIEFDKSKPDGTPKKLLSLRWLQSMGWAPKISLAEGLQLTYTWFLNNVGGSFGPRDLPGTQTLLIN